MELLNVQETGHITGHFHHAWLDLLDFSRLWNKSTWRSISKLKLTVTETWPVWHRDSLRDNLSESKTYPLLHWQFNWIQVIKNIQHIIQGQILVPFWKFWMFFFLRKCVFTEIDYIRMKNFEPKIWTPNAHFLRTRYYIKLHNLTSWPSNPLFSWLGEKIERFRSKLTFWKFSISKSLI